ncbi:hypothetical protein AAIR98_000634 [Elusimicrobium simillimum]|uniref:hypothetical protein n=1 Tax=Elusimicrobium simillimum TaxID=3143438 RepID=UPI003C6F4601
MTKEEKKEETKKTKVSKKKIIILTGLLAVALFLLLPVLDGSLRRSSTPSGKKATPQIASSNPLTKAMQFLASMLGLGKSNATADALASARPGYKAQPENLTAAQRASLGLEGGPTGGIPLTTGDYSEDGVRLPSGDYGTAEVMDKDGNWVLIKQEAPLVHTRGMYDSDMQADPASLVTGRRISDEIASRNADGLYAGIPFFKTVAKGVEAGYNLASARQGGSSAASTAFNSLSPEAFNNAELLSYVYNGGNLDDLAGTKAGADMQKIFNDLKAQMAAEGEMLKADGTKMTEKDKMDAFISQAQAERADRIVRSFGMMQDRALERLERNAKGEVEFMDKEEYDEQKCQKEPCKKPEDFTPNSLKDAYAIRMDSIDRMLTMWVPGYAKTEDKQLKEEIRSQYNNNQYKNDEDSKSNKEDPNSKNLEKDPFFFRPKMIFTILEGSKEAESIESEVVDGEKKPKAETPKCPEGEKCYWVAYSNHNLSPYYERASMAGGRMADVDKLGVTPLGNTAVDNEHWILVKQADIKNIADKTRVNIEDKSTLGNISYFWVTTTNNAVELNKEVGIEPTKFLDISKTELITFDVNTDENKNLTSTVEDSVKSIKGDLETIYGPMARRSLRNDKVLQQRGEAIMNQGEQALKVNSVSPAGK